MTEKQQLNRLPSWPEGHTQIQTTPIFVPANSGAMSNELWLTVRHYWKALVRYRWLIVLTWFSCLSMAIGFSLWMKPVYRATGRLEVGGEVSQIQTLQELYQNTVADEPFLETQVKILESDNLALQTINQLNLQNNPQFAFNKRLPENQGNALIVDALKAGISIQLIPDTRMIEINVDNHDPELAASIANSVLTNYLGYTFQKRLDSTSQASQWMQQQIADLKGRVEQSQRALVDYETRNSIVNLGDRENASQQKLEFLTKNLTDAQDERLAKQATAELVRREGIDSVTPTETMQHFQQQYAEASEAYVEALARYGSEFPTVKRLKLQLDDYEKAMEAERNRLRQRIEGDFAAAQTKENRLTLAVADQKREIADINLKLVQENLLRRDFESNQQMYDTLMQHQKDVTVSEGLRAATAHIVDRATVPVRPVRPRMVFNSAVGSAMGLVLGICLALLCRLLSNSIIEPDEAEELSAAPSLGLIPRGVKRLPCFNFRRLSMPSADSDLVLLSHPSSLQADSYRGLRTSVVQLRKQLPAKALLITSPHPREGKTRTSLNLAVSLAQRGHSVLLIDTDYRTHGIGPTISSTLGVNQSQGGLIDVLNGSKQVEQSISECAAVPNLSVLLPGRQTGDASDLLSSKAMNDLLVAVRAKFDFVVIDSPPVLGVSDSSSLAPVVDGVIMVVESESTSQEAVVRASKLIRNAGGKLLGTVLNKVDVRDSLYRDSGLYFAS